MNTTTLTESQRAQLHGLLEQRKDQLLAELGEVQRDTLAAAAHQGATEAPEDPREQADRLADTVAVFRTGETGEPSPVAAQPRAPGRAQAPRLPG